MRLKHIKIFNFKNHLQGDFHFHHDVSAIVGDNGMGKTNLLDAVYYSCLGKSYFSNTDKLVVHKEQDFFRLEATFDLQSVQEKVVVKVQPTKVKEIEVGDGKLDKLSDHIGNFPVVMVAPSDIQTLLQSSEDRRIFLNNCIVQYDRQYLHHLQLYNKLLKQRNALLKDFADRKYFDHILLQAITDKMISPAKYIHQARAEMIGRLEQDFQTLYEAISDNREQSHIVYESELTTQDMGELMHKNLSRDRASCRTSAGIHKDDLNFVMNGDHIKNYASQGQIKSYILSLKLAQYNFLHKVKHLKPILLLDDIFDKLDATRVEQLLRLVIDENFGQVLITDTHADRIPAILEKLGVSHDLFWMRSKFIS